MAAKAERIKLSSEIINFLKKKAQEFNKKHRPKRVSLAVLKTVFRRGAGVYDARHPDGKPNPRNTWAYARVNKFLEKKSGKKSAHVLDNDLLKKDVAISATPEDPKTINQRWKKKKNNIGALAHNIRSLRYNVTRDLKSEDEKVFLTALAVDLMDKTAERVGNEDSAENGNIGITGLQKRHVSIDGNTVSLKYVGKSDVEHEKSITNAGLANSVKRAIDGSGTKYLLCTSDKFRIKSDRVNRYLQDFDITAKDIRGYAANRWIIDKLKSIEPDKDKAVRQKQFNEIAKGVSKKVGHGLPTLKKHYMIPELETKFVSSGKVIDLKKYKKGGEVLAAPEVKDALMKWFGDSKVVDNNGEPKVVYHGTTHKFFTFNREKGSVEGHFGLGYYFTDSKIDAETNYLTSGADLTNRIEYLAERLVGDSDSKLDREKAKKKAARMLAGKTEITLPVFLKLENPIDLRKNGTRYDALEIEDEEGNYVEDENSLPMKLYSALQSEAYDFYDIDAQKIWNEISEEIGFDWDGTLAYKVDQAFRRSNGAISITDDAGNLASGEYIRRVYEEMGFDGVIMDADLEFGSQRVMGKKMVMDKGTIHYIAFKPEQIKLADGRNKTFDPNNPDIRYKIGGMTLDEEDKDLLKIRPFAFKRNIKSTKRFIEKHPEILLEKGGIIVHRGEPEGSVPLAKSGWVTIDKGYAAEYGKTTSFKIRRNLKVLEGQNEDGDWTNIFSKLVKEFGDGDEETLMYEPTEKFVDFLKSKGYEALANNDGIPRWLIFDKSEIQKLADGGSVTKQIERGTEGACYSNVMHYALKPENEHLFDSGKIIIGDVTNALGKTINHAWIEDGDSIIDPTTGVITSKEKYYDSLLPSSTTEYTVMEYFKMMNMTKKKGTLPPQWTNEEVKKILGRDKNPSKGKALLEVINLENEPNVINDLIDSGAWDAPKLEKGGDMRDDKIVYKLKAGDKIKLRRLPILSSKDTGGQKESVKTIESIHSIKSEDRKGEKYNTLYVVLLKFKGNQELYTATFYDNDLISVYGKKARYEPVDVKFDKGGMTDDDKKETYKKWKSLVNMSKSELQRFYESQDGKKAGLKASEAKKQGIDSGRESARWIMKMKDTPVSEWNDNMWRWAKKQISFVSRMSGMKGGLYDKKGEKTRKHLSLLIWGNNPEKKESGGGVDGIEELAKENLEEGMPDEFWGTIGVGILPICKTTGRILLNFRSSFVMEPNTFGTYGGKLDDDELEGLDGAENAIKQVRVLLDAAKRELEEETGYDDEMEVIPSYIFESGVFTYYNFLGLVEEEFEPIMDWESDGYQWVNLTEFLKIEPKHFGLKELIKNNLEQIKKYADDSAISCESCGWGWKESETQENDRYICHKCGHDNEQNYIMSKLKTPMSLPEISAKHNIEESALQTELERGIKHEMEHTTDEKIAETIALHHLEERADYYEMLDKAEGSGGLTKVAYANYLLDEVEKQMVKKGWSDAAELKKGLAKSFNDTMKDRGEIRAISNLEDTYMAQLPKEVRGAAAYEALKKNYKNENKIIILENNLQTLKEGGVVVGKRHSEADEDGNTGERFLVKSTGQVVELEGGEGVMCSESMQSDKRFAFNGKKMTAREIASLLNHKYGGVEFAKGGDLKSVCGCKTYEHGGELPTATVDTLNGGEAVVTVKTMESNDKYDFNGSQRTPREILGNINSRFGGKTFEEGGVIDLKNHKISLDGTLAKMGEFVQKVLYI